jgi:general secretion pathway protein D
MRRVGKSLLLLVIFSALLPTASWTKDKKNKQQAADTQNESAGSLYKKGVDAEARRDYVAAYFFYKGCYSKQPTNMKYQVPYERTRFLAAAELVHRGQKTRDQGKLPEALALFQQAAEIDPSNDLAAQEIRRTQQMMQKGGGEAAPTSRPPSASRREEEDPLRKMLEEASGPAALTPLTNIPLVALEMTDDTKILYETLGKLGNINVLFDPDYTSRRLPIRLKNVNLQEALNILALQSRTFWRPVTPNTIFVAQDTQAKRRELEQNVVKTFYLGNVSTPTDLQDIVNAIRTVLEVQRIQQIPSQSAIVIKGTPDQLALAEKMIDDIDKAKPEVIVDVVVAQVRRDKLRNLGITPPQNATVALQSVGTSVTTTGTSSSSPINLNDLQHLNSTNYVVAIDPVKFTAILTDTNSKILQSPRIRASDNEKAQLKIADKIPIATGSFGTPVGVGAAVGAVGVNTQFTYTDVGVILEITPRVHPDGEVTLKTVMEISNQNGNVIIGGIQQPIISTRRVEHTIRLNDGEINLLGGILETQENKSANGTPILGEIPILKWIFSQQQKEVIHNEIVFLLTPHIVRSQELNDLNKRAFDVGTGSGIDLRIGSRARPETAAPAASVQPGAAQPGAAQQPAAQPATQPAASQQAQPAPSQPRAAAMARPAVPPATSPATQQSQTAAAQPPPVGAATPAPPAPGGPANLRLDPSSLTPAQGSTFTVNITLAHGQDVASASSQIAYDPKVLQFVSIVNGDFLAKDGQPVALVHRDDPSTGKLQATAQRPPGMPGVTGEGTVFSLTFMAKAKGSSTISIASPGARNSQGQVIEVSGSQASVKVE